MSSRSQCSRSNRGNSSSERPRKQARLDPYILANIKTDPDGSVLHQTCRCPSATVPCHSIEPRPGPSTSTHAASSAMTPQQAGSNDPRVQSSARKKISLEEYRQKHRQKNISSAPVTPAVQGPTQTALQTPNRNHQKAGPSGQGPTQTAIQTPNRNHQKAGPSGQGPTQTAIQTPNRNHQKAGPSGQGPTQTAIQTPNRNHQKAGPSGQEPTPVQTTGSTTPITRNIKLSVKRAGQTVEMSIKTVNSDVDVSIQMSI